MIPKAAATTTLAAIAIAAARLAAKTSDHAWEGPEAAAAAEAAQAAFDAAVAACKAAGDE